MLIPQYPTNLKPDIGRIDRIISEDEARLVRLLDFDFLVVLEETKGFFEGI
jgi:hypothetical protein